MHKIRGSLSVSQRQQDVEQIVNTHIQIYSIKYNKHVTEML